MTSQHPGVVRNHRPVGRFDPSAPSVGIRESNGERGTTVAAVNASTEEKSSLFGHHFSLDPLRSTSSTAPNTSESTVDALLRSIPSNGWIGRRDRALVVLSQIAALPYESIAELTVADITVRDGIAVVKTPGGRTTLRKSDDALVCAPCSLARWLHALDMTVVYGSCRVSTAAIARAAPLTTRSPHLCQGNVGVTESTARLPLLPGIDQYGPLTPSRPPVATHPRPARSIVTRIPAQRGTDPRQGAVDARRPGPAGPDFDPQDARVHGLEGRVRYLLEYRSDHPEML